MSGGFNTRSWLSLARLGDGERDPTLLLPLEKIPLGNDSSRTIRDFPSNVLVVFYRLRSRPASPSTRNIFRNAPSLMWNPHLSTFANAPVTTHQPRNSLDIEIQPGLRVGRVNAVKRTITSNL